MDVETLSGPHKLDELGAHSEHLLALDGVRGLAISMVLALHILTSNVQTGEAFFDFISSIRSSLWVGVDLFFALSGFLITGILFDSLQKRGYFLNFYARRALRIFPLYYGFLLALIVLTYPLHLQWQGKQYLLLTYTQNLGIFTKDYMGFTPAPFINLNHFWSLAVEEQFYFIWPLIVFLVRDWRKLLGIGLGLSLGALVLRIVFFSDGALPATLYEFTPCRMDALLMGGSLALLYRSTYRSFILRYSTPAFLFLLVCLIWMALPLNGLIWSAPVVETYGYSLTALTSTLLIATTLARGSWSRLVFETRLLRFLGKYSYGIYVFHYSIDVAITASLRRWLLATFHSKPIAVILASVPVVLLTIVLAVASYHLYEKRFLSLKRYFDPNRAVPLGITIHS